MSDPDPDSRDVILPPNPSLAARLRDFWSHPARPWQFWYPQSGLYGGIFFAGLAIVIVIFFVL